MDPQGQSLQAHLRDKQCGSLVQPCQLLPHLYHTRGTPQWVFTELHSGTGSWSGVCGDPGCRASSEEKVSCINLKALPETGQRHTGIPCRLPGELWDGPQFLTLVAHGVWWGVPSGKRQERKAQAHLRSLMGCS